MRGHLYCSTRCARDAGRFAMWRALQGHLVRRVPARLAVAAVALAAFAPVILALRTVRELEALSTPSPVAPPRRAAPAAQLESFRETASGVVIEGTATEGSAVFLFAGGRFLTSVPAVNGRFRFENVREKGPYRVGAMSLSAEAAVPDRDREPAAPPTAPAVRRAPPALVPTAPPPPIKVTAAAALPAVPALAPAPPPVAPAQARSLAAPDMTRGPSDRREVLVSFDAGSSD